jgi:outer membrane protein
VCGRRPCAAGARLRGNPEPDRRRHRHDAALLRHARITGDAADSPIVAERGKRDQVTAGFGVGYTWK